VLLVDAAKGCAACVFGFLICSFFYGSTYCGLHSTSDPEPPDLFSVTNYFMVLAGICAVLGHNYTCWLKFKGGKGIATTAGVYVALAPWPLLIALGVFILALLLTRYVSVGSIAAAIALPTAVWVMTPNNTLLGIVTTALGALAIYKHKANIQRLIAGTENRLGAKKKESTP
jgi:acyl phosphate:glycerol-3-phosphate acyltransferase